MHKSNGIHVTNHYVKLGECMDKPTVGRFTLKDKKFKGFRGCLQICIGLCLLFLGAML